jgi:hypothetical protein
MIGSSTLSAQEDENWNLYQRLFADLDHVFQQIAHQSATLRVLVVHLSENYHRHQIESRRGFWLSIELDWTVRTNFHRSHEERIRAFCQIVLMLDRSLSPRGVGNLFQTHIRFLGDQQPLDVIANGQAQAVRSAAAAIFKSVNA